MESGLSDTDKIREFSVRFVFFLIEKDCMQHNYRLLIVYFSQVKYNMMIRVVDVLLTQFFFVNLLPI